MLGLGWVEQELECSGFGGEWDWGLLGVGWLGELGSGCTGSEGMGWGRAGTGYSGLGDEWDWGY